jgi:hypothetical protein
MADSKSHQARVFLVLYNLQIEISADPTYPDQLTDMCNRAIMLMAGALHTAKEAKIDIRDSDFEYDEEED